MIKFVFSAIVVLMMLTDAVGEDIKLNKAWETETVFKAPESVAYDEQRDVLYVSNVAGPATEANGAGFISKVALDGSIMELQWGTGLDAPKGLSIHGDKLYAADINKLVEIDIETGEVTHRYTAPDAVFLNDVATDDQGLVYVSDMLDDSIYRLEDGKFSLWLHTKALEAPNGLHVQGHQIIVGSWGAPTDGFKTDIPGHLKAVLVQDQSVTSLGDGTPVGNLDGVKPDGQGAYYVTDWMAGTLLHIHPDGKSEVILQLVPGAADHEVILNKNLIVIPMMQSDQVVAYEVGQKK